MDSDKHRQAESLQTSDNKESVSPIKTDLVSQGKSLNLNNGTETKSISVKGIKEEKLGTESLVGIDTVPAFISNNQTEVISKDSVTEEIISSNQTHFIKAFEADHDSLRIKPEINVTGMAANIRAEKEDPSKEMIPCIKMEPFDHEWMFVIKNLSYSDKSQLKSNHWCLLIYYYEFAKHQPMQSPISKYFGKL